MQCLMISWSMNLASRAFAVRDARGQSLKILIFPEKFRAFGLSLELPLMLVGHIDRRSTTLSCHCVNRCSRVLPRWIKQPLRWSRTALADDRNARCARLVAILQVRARGVMIFDFF